MTAQEQQMLQGLTDRINKTQLPEKDAEAEQMLDQTLGRNPDALYVLAQTVLVQQYALDQAQKQLADARAQMEQLRQQPTPQPKHATSFLGNLLGLNEDEPARPQAPPPLPQQPQYAPVPGYAAGPGYAQPVAYSSPGGFGAPQGGGFLRSAMQTATGVAAGALAFEGIESLMHGFGHSAGYGSGFGGGGFGEGGRPEVVNNYYGDSSGAGEHGGHEHGDSLSPDIEDRRGGSAFSNAVDGNDRDSLGAVDNTGGSYDDSSSSGDQDTSSDADTSSDFDSDSGGGFDGSDSGGGDFGGDNS